MTKRKNCKLLVVGLGNPGDEYRATYHNIGHAFVDYCARQARGGAFRAVRSKQFEYFTAGRLTLLKPCTFMNESGWAVASALRYFKRTPGSLVLVHDDSDIALGDYKIAFGRGAAGHRGVQSVIDALRTNAFWRARIGVRSSRGKAGSLVLRPIPTTHRDALHFVFGEIRSKLIENEMP